MTSHESSAITPLGRCLTALHRNTEATHVLQQARAIFQKLEARTRARRSRPTSTIRRRTDRLTSPAPAFRKYTLRPWNSGATSAAPQNPDSGSADSKPEHKAHNANAMRVEAMARERHVRRATSIIERERETTVKHEHHAHHEQRSRRQEANELHRAESTRLNQRRARLTVRRCLRLANDSRRYHLVHPWRHFPGRPFSTR